MIALTIEHLLMNAFLLNVKLMTKKYHRNIKDAVLHHSCKIIGQGRLIL
jgi:hypothetical protein